MPFLVRCFFVVRLVYSAFVYAYTIDTHVHTCELHAYAYFYDQGRYRGARYYMSYSMCAANQY
jgi:hypothetical protein